MRASQIAQALNVSPQTVRNWAVEIGPKLGIVKEPSGLWAFSPEHVDTLRLVRDQLAAGYTYDDVAQMIENGELGSVAIPSQLDLVKTLTGAIDTLAERIRALEAKVDNLGDQLALPPAKEDGAFVAQPLSKTGRENGRKQATAFTAVIKKAWDLGRRLTR